MFCILRHKNDPVKAPILIVNTHLIYNPQRGDVKLGQILLILRAIEQIKIKYNVSDIMFAGDFNFIPNSLFYSLIQHRNVRLDLPTSMMSGQIFVSSSKFKRLPIKKQIEINDKKIDVDFLIKNHTKYQDEFEDRHFDVQRMVRLVREIMDLEFHQDPYNHRIGVSRTSSIQFDSSYKD